MKFCNKCEISKSLDNFYRDKKSVDGYRCTCKQCTKTVNELWKKQNPDKLQILRNRYYHNNKENVKQRATLWAQKNKLKRRKICSTWKQNNLDKVCTTEAKRRASKLNAVPKWLTAEHKKQIKDLYKNCPKGYHVDHIIPLQGKEVCGLHVPWNLQILSASDNIRKHNRLAL